jgi:hypothetical protein
MITTFYFENSIFSVAERATRTAYIVDSVPLVSEIEPDQFQNDYRFVLQHLLKLVTV